MKKSGVSRAQSFSDLLFSPEGDVEGEIFVLLSLRRAATRSLSDILRFRGGGAGSVFSMSRSKLENEPRRTVAPKAAYKFGDGDTALVLSANIPDILPRRRAEKDPRREFADTGLSDGGTNMAPGELRPFEKLMREERRRNMGGDFDESFSSLDEPELVSEVGGVGSIDSDKDGVLLLRPVRPMLWEGTGNAESKSKQLGSGVNSFFLAASSRIFAS